MHLTTTNPVSGIWRQYTRAGVIPAISFTRLSRRHARIPAHAMRMRAFPRMRCECAHMRACDANVRICAHFRACDANARICAHFAHAMRMLAHARISPHAMRCDAMRMRACDAMPMRASRGNLCVSGTVLPMGHNLSTICKHHRLPNSDEKQNLALGDLNDTTDQIWLYNHLTYYHGKIWQ